MENNKLRKLFAKGPKFRESKCIDLNVAEKAVYYGLEHANQSLDACSYDEVVRSAKSALEFLDDQWTGNPTLEGDARMLLASAYQMTGATNDALKEFESAIAVFDVQSTSRNLLELS